MKYGYGKLTTLLKRINWKLLTDTIEDDSKNADKNLNPVGNCEQIPEILVPPIVFRTEKCPVIQGGGWL